MYSYTNYKKAKKLRKRQNTSSKYCRRLAPFGAVSLVVAAMEVISVGSFYNTNVSALDFQDNVNILFTFDPAIVIAVSDDLVINNLIPGSSAESNTVTVTTGANTVNGYKLYASVGNSSNAYTDLRITPSNSTNKFTSLATNANIADVASITSGYWGYAYRARTESGSSYPEWGSWSSYNGLPLYTITPGAQLVSASGASSSEVQFKIGANALSTQAAGTYSNVINFIGVANVITTSYTVNYIDSSGEATNMPAQQTGTTDQAFFTISRQIPVREGYTFMGWCNASTSDETCSGNTYAPNAIYGIENPTSSATINLYAMWQSNVSLIDFYIQYCDNSGNCSNRGTYHAEEGMTWAEWVESEYNTINEYSYDIEIRLREESWYGNDAIIREWCDTGNSYPYYPHCDIMEILNNPGGYYEHESYALSTDTINAGWIYNLSVECLTGDHLITMADGSYKRLDQIKCGDLVQSYDWDSMKLVPKKVIFTDADEGKSHTEYDKWTYSDGTIIKTVHRHEFYNVEAKRFKYMDEWGIGEHTYKEDGTHPELVAHETIKKAVRHYKITLEGGTNFFANGLLTGDRHNPKDIVL